MSQSLYIGDLFCGAGGFSTAMLSAAQEMGVEVGSFLAVNHWPTAIATHSANHPGVLHYCESIEGVDPRKAVPGGRLHVLMASPECVHHSNARGGKPMNDQSRATAWHVLRWAEALYIDNILIENVKEFQSWGPLDESGRPIQSMKGRLYRQFLSSLRALGYTVDVRILNAADYGDATTRHRMFIQARRGSKKPTWPQPTHIKSDDLGLYPECQPWRAAREVIDWNLPGKSIYGRKKSLSPNTLRRIYAGLAKYSGLPFLFGAGGPAGQGQPRSAEDPLRTVLTENHQALAQPYLVVLRNNADAKSLDEPVPTLCTANHVGIVEPFLVNMKGQSNACDVDAPAPTITAHAPHLYLAEPFLIATGHKGGNGSYVYGPERPLPTLTTQQEIGVVEPYLVKFYQGSDACSLENPLPTVTASYEHMGLCEPFIVPLTHSGGPDRSHSADAPLPTITTAHRGEFALCQPYMIAYHGEKKGEDPRTLSVEGPLSTLDTSNRLALVQPYLVNYNGTGHAHSVDAPMSTITTNDRFGLVSPELITDGLIEKGDVIAYLDIRFRMLQPKELAAAHSFPEDYQFAGNRDDQVRQVGNSVAVRVASALCREILKQYASEAKQ